MAPTNCNNSLKLLILLGTLGLVCGANLRCYKGSLNNFIEISLDDPEVFLKSSCFDAKKNTIIYAFGFQENSTDSSVLNIIGTYLHLNHNALLMNWENEDTVPGLGFASYPIVVSNLSKVGEKLGQAIVKLSNAGFSLPSLHLLGFSLGAHLMGYAGKEVKNHGLLISRMTLFDPAGPLFEGPYSGANKDCAKSVVVIHGNPGRLGTVKNVGTVDIWTNCPCSVQPGCEHTKTGTFPQDGCSHERSWMYFVESLRRKKAFPAIAAASCGQWKEGKGTDQIIYLGDNIDGGVKGKFYLRTNSEDFFGLGMEGTKPVNTVCSPDLELNLNLTVMLALLLSIKQLNISKRH